MQDIKACGSWYQSWNVVGARYCWLKLLCTYIVVPFFYLYRSSFTHMYSSCIVRLYSFAFALSSQLREERGNKLLKQAWSSVEWACALDRWIIELGYDRHSNPSVERACSKRLEIRQMWEYALRAARTSWHPYLNIPTFLWFQVAKQIEIRKV